jgi:hypothetical protein
VACWCAEPPSKENEILVTAHSIAMQTDKMSNMRKLKATPPFVLLHALLLVGVLALASCTGNIDRSTQDDSVPADKAREESQTVEENPQAAAAVAEGATDMREGAFTVPEGWSLYDTTEGYVPETGEKLFLLPDGVAMPEDRAPTNISVMVGENRYSAADHMAFRDGILKSFSAQMTDDIGVVTGGGSGTKNGYVLYTFTLKSDDLDTIFYYVVGERKYFEVQISDWFDPAVTDAEEAGYAIADSFVWYV